MAFYDVFFDWLADLVDEWSEYKRNRSKYRFTDENALSRQYKRRSQEVPFPDSDDSIGDLTRYDGINEKYERERRMAYQHLRDPELMTQMTHEEELEEYMSKYGSDFRPPAQKSTDAQDVNNEDYSRRIVYDDLPQRSVRYRTFASQDDLGGHYIRSSRSQYSDSRWHSPYDSSRSTVRNQKKRLTTLQRVLLLFIILLAVLIPTGVFIAATTASQSEPVITPPEDTHATEPVYDDEGEQIILTEEDLMLIEAQGILDSLTKEEKVGSLLLLRSNDMSDDSFKSTISSCHAGGVVLFGKDVKDKSESGLTDYISQLQTAGGGHMLICVDEEGGSVVRVSNNRNLRSSSFRSPQALYASGGLDLVRSDAAEKCDFLAKFGINVNFGPVSDVVTSTKAYMYDRAFGRDAEQTAQYVDTVVSVMNEKHMGSTLKHFPGYGNSSGNTHNGLVVVDTALTVLRERDLLPFKAGIDAGADAVMVTHTIMSSIDADRPASLSPTVISLLRDEIGFDGVIVSDGLDMDAISEYSGGEDVCITAFLAGNDLLCTPVDAAVAYSSLLEAVNDGRISEQRLDESVRRIILWKLHVGAYSDEG